MPLARRASLLLPILLLAGCASDMEGGRARMVVPREIGTVYSEVEAQTRLAVTPELECKNFDCLAHEQFQRRVNHLGKRLGDSAYKLALEINLHPPQFNISVPGKDDIGTLSTAAGSIIVFDGLLQLSPEDPALAFLIAREMGHVLARHHEENSANSLTISIALALIFPMAQALRSAEAAYSAAATTSSLVSSAASFAGSKIIKGMYRDEQRREADILALRILAHAGWSAFEVAAALDRALPRFTTEGWMGELLESKRWLDQIATGPQPLQIEQEEWVVQTDTPVQDILATEAEPIEPVDSPSRQETSLPASPPADVLPMPAPLPVAAAFAAEPASKFKERPVLKFVNPAEKKLVRSCSQKIVQGRRKIVCSMPVAASTKKPPARPGNQANRGRL